MYLYKKLIYLCISVKKFLFQLQRLMTNINNVWLEITGILLNYKLYIKYLVNN